MALVGPRSDQVDRPGAGAVEDSSRFTVVIEFLGTLDEPHEPDQVRRIDKLAPSVEGLSELQVELRQQPEGVQLNADALAGHAVALEHFLDHRGLGVAFGVLPNAHVLAQ